MAFKNPENVRAFNFYAFFLSLKIASTSSINIIDFFGAIFKRRLKLKSLIWSEQLTKHMEFLISAAKAWANELFPVPGGPNNK
jgi:hypothetical protein